MVYSQKKPWFELDFRKKNYPSKIFYSQYAESATKKEALKIAKVELSKSISTEISVSSTSVAVTRNAVLNDVFKETASSESSLSISGLEEKVAYTRKKKTWHVLVYIKKEDLKALTKNIYEDLLNTITGDVNACQKMFYDQSYKRAKEKGDQIEVKKKKLKRLKNLLSIFRISYDGDRYNDVIELFEPLYAKIKKQISDEEDYKYNKDRGDLKALSNDETDLESALSSYAKAQRINPNLAKGDGLPLAINKIKEELYKIYCQKGMNYEQELKYPSAINYYRKARDIYPNKNIPGEKETTTDKIKLCQDQQIEILEKKGLNELEENPETSLAIFKEAKRLIDDMQRTNKIIPINKLIRKAERKVKKLNKKRAKIIRRGRLRVIRHKSPNRLVLKIGGGLHTPESYYQHIYDNPIDINKDNWHLSTSLGYRIGLPTEIKTTQEGFELSRGNVVGLFGNIGSTNLIKENDTININSSFKEIEFGVLLKEWFRLSVGLGSREIPKQYNDDFISNYYIATTGIILHFKSRFSTEFTVSYIIDEELDAQTARFNITLGLRFYLFKKVFKTEKDKL